MIEINEADVAELVDARDLKCLAGTDPIETSCKTVGESPIETDGTNRDLQNTFGPGWRLLDHMARDLYRAIPTMPKPARRFAYNLIELIHSDAMFRPPMGDHPLQHPRVLFERQMVALERALAAARTYQ